MQLIERFKNLSAVVQVAVAFLALLPGLASLIGLVSLPDMISGLVTFLFGFLGIGTLALVAVLSGRIARAGSGAIAGVVAGMLLAGSASATAYALFADEHVVPFHDNGKVLLALVPLSPDAELSKALSSYDGDYAQMLESSNRRYYLLQQMDRQDTGTTLILIALLMASQLLLVGGATVALWRASLD